MTHQTSRQDVGLPHFRFSTAEERPDQQFEAWRSAMSGSIDVRRPELETNRPGFAATLDAWNLGGMALVSMGMPGEGHERNWDHNRHAELDHWSLMVPVADGAGRRYDQRPVSFGSMGRAFTGAGSDTKVVSLFLPRDGFREAAGRLDAAGNTPADRGMTALMVDFILSLEQQLASGGGGLDAETITSAVQRIVLAGLAPSPSRIDDARSLLQSGLVERMRRHIRQNLAAPDLGWAMLCRHFEVSRSNLFRLFEPHGGVESVIRAERLHAVHRALAAGGERASIAALAERYGFQDPSTFSRAFRREFGYSPRETRSIRLSGQESGTTPAPPPFDGFLKGLREAGEMA